VRWGQIEFQPEHIAIVQDVYRPDLYRAARACLPSDMPAIDTKIEGAQGNDSEGFFDARRFDPAALAAYCNGFD
jgi:two-component system, oxyanion-binding sensor